MHGIDADLDDLGQYVGWDQQEKFRGARFSWTGRDAFSKGGREIEIPDEWREGLPSGVSLDCELYDGVDGERRCASVIRYGLRHITKGMRIIAFDLPDADTPWIVRKHALVQAVEDADFHLLEFAPFSNIASLEALLDSLQAVKSRDGEGLMLRDPCSRYTPGRHPCLIKLKHAA